MAICGAAMRYFVIVRFQGPAIFNHTHPWVSMNERWVLLINQWDGLYWRKLPSGSWQGR